MILMVISIAKLSAAEFAVTGSRAVFDSRNRPVRSDTIDITDGNVLMTGKEDVVLSSSYLTVTVKPESVVILKDTVFDGFVVYLVDGRAEVSSSVSAGVTLYTTVTRAQGHLNGTVSLVSTENEESIKNSSSGEFALYDGIRDEYIPLASGGIYDYFTASLTMPAESVVFDLCDSKVGDRPVDGSVIGVEFEDFVSLSERLLFAFGKDLDDSFVRLG